MFECSLLIRLNYSCSNVKGIRQSPAFPGQTLTYGSTDFCNNQKLKIKQVCITSIAINDHRVMNGLLVATVANHLK